MEEKLNEIYGKIADALNETIPEDWDKIIMYGEVLEDVSEAFFNYYPAGSTKSVFSHEITHLFDMSDEEYNQLWLQLLDNLEELHDVFIQNGQETWTNLTFTLESTGKFKIDYDYTDLSNADDIKRHLIWDYVHLGVMPDSVNDKKIVEEYIKNNQVK